MHKKINSLRRLMLFALCVCLALTAALLFSGCDDGELKRQLAKLEEQQAQQARRIADLEDELAKKNARILEFTSELNKEIGKNIELEKELEKLNDEMEKEFKKLNDKIKDLEEEMEKLIAEMEEDLRMTETWGHYYAKYKEAVEWGYERTIGIFMATLLGDGGSRNDGSDVELSAYEVYKKYHPDYTSNEMVWRDQLLDGELLQRIRFVQSPSDIFEHGQPILTGRIITLQRAYEVGLVTVSELQKLRDYHIIETLFRSVQLGYIDEVARVKIECTPASPDCKYESPRRFCGVSENCIVLRLGPGIGAAVVTLEIIGGIVFGHPTPGYQLGVYFE